MAEDHKESVPVHGGHEKVGDKKDQKKLKKNKWLLIGGLGVVAVLVFYFVNKSKQSAAASTSPNSGGLDPATAAALQAALANQGYGPNAGGVPGPVGPAGPAGPPGKQGPPGKGGGDNDPRHKRHHYPILPQPWPRHIPPPIHRLPPHTTPIPWIPHHRHGSFATARPGETLGDIASRNGTNAETLYSNNRHTIGSNPSMVQPGMRLRI